MIDNGATEVAVPGARHQKVQRQAGRLSGRESLWEETAATERSVCFAVKPRHLRYR